MARLRVLPGGAASALLLLSLTAAAPHALAQSFTFGGGTHTTIPTSLSPVVRIQARAGIITIRPWNRSQVQVNSPDALHVRRFPARVVAAALARGAIPINATSIVSTGGRQVTLPPEEFSLASVPPGSHDGIMIQASQARATIMVPSGTALILANVGRGAIHLAGLHGPAFVAILHNGFTTLQNVSGSGYVQVARGRILARNSNFSQIRARTAAGNILFEGCHSTQIEVSSINGSIVYDNGTFDRGLARFESQNGNVALGIARGSGAQIGAHSSAGRIFSSLRGAQPRAGTTDTQTAVGGGGPVVTASSQRGGVYIYDGRLKSHPNLGARWRRLNRAFRRVPRLMRPRRVSHPPRVVHLPRVFRHRMRAGVRRTSITSG